MRKFILAIFAVAMCATSSMAASPQGGIFKHLGVGVGVGTTGVTIEASSPVTRWLQVRAGLSMMPGITFTTEGDVQLANSGYNYGAEYDLDMNLARTQGSLIVNVYPSPWGSFFIAGGAYFGGGKLLKIEGYNADFANVSDAEIAIGNYLVPTHNGHVQGGLKVKNVRPYLGIGWGRPVPNRRLNFGVELGVQFMGKSKIYSDYGTVTYNPNGDEDDDIQKIMDKVSVYPVLTFRLNGRIF